MGKAEPRIVTPLISALRNFLLGRSHLSPLRFGDFYAARTQPPPELPGGPANKLADNYYYARDGRREATPPNVLLTGGSQKSISGQSKEESQVKAVDVSSRTPGSLYRWD